jgi:C-terminal processing protease CtpA/Prc
MDTASKPRRALVLPLIALCALLAAAPDAQAKKKSKRYEKDIAFALKELEKDCKHFFKTKDINWRAVSKEMKKAAKQIETDADHVGLLVRLLARLEDGHARIEPATKDAVVPWPESMKTRLYAPGMYWCQVGERVYAKVTFGPAKSAGIEPGSEIIAIDGTKIHKWLPDRIARLRDTRSFSTDHQAHFHTCHWGLSEPQGTRLKVAFTTPAGKRKDRTITVDKHRPFVLGPAALPEGIQSTDDLNYAKTKAGFGYIHVRRCKGTVVEQMDQALAALGDVPGLILDFRGNSGGGFDHEALFGRFVPQGESIKFNKRYESAGPKSFTGNMVVIVDGTVVSAGETASGMFKEDGRAYMIGESPTAGMSSSKKTLDLPSGICKLYYSVSSNMGRFNRGQGIEGIGVPPHEIVSFDPKDLAAGADTLIKRAEALLADFPADDVPYKAPKAR